MVAGDCRAPRQPASPGFLGAEGARKLRLTGGEPLLRRDLEQLIAMLAGIGGIQDIALTTNGELLGVHDPGPAAVVARCRARPAAVPVHRPDSVPTARGHPAVVTRNDDSGEDEHPSWMVPTVEG